MWRLAQNRRFGLPANVCFRASRCNSGRQQLADNGRWRFRAVNARIDNPEIQRQLVPSGCCTENRPLRIFSCDSLKGVERHLLSLRAETLHFSIAPGSSRQWQPRQLRVPRFSQAGEPSEVRVKLRAFRFPPKSILARVQSLSTSSRRTGRHSTKLAVSGSDEIRLEQPGFPRPQWQTSMKYYK